MRLGGITLAYALSSLSDKTSFSDAEGEQARSRYYLLLRGLDWTR